MGQQPAMIHGGLQAQTWPMLPESLTTGMLPAIRAIESIELESITWMATSETCADLELWHTARPTFMR